MPSLPKPRLRRHRGAELVAPAEPRERSPQVETVQGSGLRWVNIERPTPLESAWLEEHFDFHALDLEDVLSRNQRPKIDEYPDYLFIVLHFPVFDRAGQAAERRRARHLRRPRLPGHDPEHAAAAGRVPVRALPPEGGAARAALLPRLRLPALPDRRRQLRLLLPDAAQDRQQARRARGRDLRGEPLGGHRPRHLQRQAGDHQLPQGDPPAADGAARPREARAAASSPPRAASSRSTSTTSATATSGSGTCSRTTRRSSRRSRRRTSPTSRTASTTSCACSPRSASSSCR